MKFLIFFKNLIVASCIFYIALILYEKNLDVVEDKKSTFIMQKKTSASLNNQHKKIDITLVQQAHLFDVLEKSEGHTKEQILETQPTSSSLPILLKGIAYHVDGLSAAFLSIKGESLLVYRGDIIYSQDVLVDEILEDRLYISNKGFKEVIFLYEEDIYNNAIQIDLLDDPVATQIASKHKALWGVDANLVVKLFIVSLVKSTAGMTLGYQLTPGEYDTDFYQLGFKSGDIVKKVNGISVLSVPTLKDILFHLLSSSTAEFIIERESRMVIVKFSFV